MYADVDGWKPGEDLVEPTGKNVLDKWMLSRLNETIKVVTEEADAYRTPRLVREITLLIDDASNWFVRRSRRRFWKSEDDGDKQAAYETLHYTLVRVAQLLAPWAPFVSDKLWRDLTADMNVPKSVHLSDWPEAGKVSRKTLDDMAAVREAITVGLAQRAEAKVKVRQPLSAVTVGDLPEAYADIIAEEGDTVQEDFETHYNMGTAYKEMDLMDEAIQEFQTSANLVKPGDGTSRFLQCCNMLGHCFIHKDMPEAAVLWFKKGLQAPGHTEDEYQALRYELASAYEQLGDLKQAREFYTEVYGVDVSYREVAEKLSQLRQKQE